MPREGEFEVDILFHVENYNQLQAGRQEVKFLPSGPIWSSSTCIATFVSCISLLGMISALLARLYWDELQWLYLVSRNSCSHTPKIHPEKVCKEKTHVNTELSSNASICALGVNRPINILLTHKVLIMLDQIKNSKLIEKKPGS